MDEKRIKRVETLKKRLSKVSISQHWYPHMSGSDKKRVKAIIVRNSVSRKHQLSYIEQMMVVPVKNAIRAGERVMKGEITLEEYLYIEEETSKYLMKILASIAPKKKPLKAQRLRK